MDQSNVQPWLYSLNRIGNLLVPNSNYCAFEDWVVPLLDVMVKEQEEDGVKWAPSSVINRLGKEIDNEESVYYWCYKVSIGHLHHLIALASMNQLSHVSLEGS